jgi:hypothetical protein
LQRWRLVSFRGLRPRSRHSINRIYGWWSTRDCDSLGERDKIIIKVESVSFWRIRRLVLILHKSRQQTVWLCVEQHRMSGQKRTPARIGKSTTVSFLCKLFCCWIW